MTIFGRNRCVHVFYLSYKYSLCVCYVSSSEYAKIIWSHTIIYEAFDKAETHRFKFPSETKRYNKTQQEEIMSAYRI
jgi:hypothetical protein